MSSMYQSQPYTSTAASRRLSTKLPENTKHLRPLSTAPITIHNADSHPPSPTVLARLACPALFSRDPSGSRRPPRPVHPCFLHFHALAHPVNRLFSQPFPHPFIVAGVPDPWHRQWAVPDLSLLCHLPNPGGVDEIQDHLGEAFVLLHSFWKAVI